MLGAIIGDIIGSTFEWKNAENEDFQFFAQGSTFTDDTVLTIAMADALLTNTTFVKSFKKWANNYPAFYKNIPNIIADKALSYLSSDMLLVYNLFNEKYKLI